MVVMAHIHALGIHRHRGAALVHVAEAVFPHKHPD
jgi:hypothetical protein